MTLGLDNIRCFYEKYGDWGVDQGKIMTEGQVRLHPQCHATHPHTLCARLSPRQAYLNKDFPFLDYIESCRMLPETPPVPRPRARRAAQGGRGGHGNPGATVPPKIELHNKKPLTAEQHAVRLVALFAGCMLCCMLCRRKCRSSR